jgi:hypothetical protein
MLRRDTLREPFANFASESNPVLFPDNNSSQDEGTTILRMFCRYSIAA